MNVLGWIFVPALMLILCWNELGTVNRAFGIVWTVVSAFLSGFIWILLFIVISPIVLLQKNKYKRSGKMTNSNGEGSNRCIYCGDSVGFMRVKHKECEKKNREGKQEILRIIESFLDSDSNLAETENKVKTISDNSFINYLEMQKNVLKGWERAIDRALEDRILSKDEERRLLEISGFFELENIGMKETYGFEKIVRAAALREVMEGIVPERLNIEMNLPFNFQKTEKLVWVFPAVDYHEMKTNREFVGGSRGVGIRVAKGVYIRTGGFRGHSVETKELAYIDSGLFAVTDQHIYFSGATENFRINYDKIVSFNPHSDGIGIQRDSQTAKPQLFRMNKQDDSWFAYNLITNLARL